ncbi:MAG TPA: N-acetyltransferase [Candidatus Acidoferrales bacterium]|nr:N-acetyltransferase [Candidatus Acidoferrales bacterium]
MLFSLRAYRPSDFEALYQVDRQCYAPQIAYSRGELRRYLQLPGAECVIGEAEGKLAGFCLSARQGGYGYIITMDVLAAYRRQGAATALLDEIERRLAAHDVRVVGLETATDNGPAIAFWSKHGYRKRCVRKGYYPGGRDAYTMSKELTAPAEPPREKESS